MSLRPIRCAIYTRKSAEERGDGQFTTLDNQRSFCAAYITSQAGNGWCESPERYDDGGFSGGSLKRPALDKLRADVDCGAVDMIVVYKIDRLSRSLSDFANLVTEIQQRGAGITSVTQSFDTSTAMGKMTLNVMLTFAQFEREMTSERLSDWFAGARSRGLWPHRRPFGYRKNGHALVVDEDEAKTVRWIFQRYARGVMSAETIADDLYLKGVVNTLGNPWTGNMIRRTIRNPVYVGKLAHRGEALPGIHVAIVAKPLWDRANRILAIARSKRAGTGQDKPLPLLKDLLIDRTGQKITHTFSLGKGRLYRYYVAQQEMRHGYGEGSDPYMRFRADALETAVCEAVGRLTGTRQESMTTPAYLREWLRRHVAKINVAPDRLLVTFRTGASIELPPAGQMQPRRRSPRAKRIPLRQAETQATDKT